MKTLKETGEYIRKSQIERHEMRHNAEPDDWALTPDEIKEMDRRISFGDALKDYVHRKKCKKLVAYLLSDAPLDEYDRRELAAELYNFIQLPRRGRPPQNTALYSAVSDVERVFDRWKKLNRLHNISDYGHRPAMLDQCIDWVLSLEHRINPKNKGITADAIRLYLKKPKKQRQINYNYEVSFTIDNWLERQNNTKKNR